MATATAPVGIIEPEKLYRLEILKSVSGIGDWGLRQMRRAGLRVRYVGGRGFVKGADFIAHIEQFGEEKHSHAKAAGAGKSGQ